MINPDRFELQIVRKCVNIIFLNFYNLKQKYCLLTAQKVTLFCCTMLLQLTIIPTEFGQQSASIGLYRRLLDAKKDRGF